MLVTTSPQLPTIDPMMDVEIAVLDEDGTIVGVNESWIAFSLYNGGDPAACGMGTNYLEICDRTADDPETADIARLIRAATRRELLSATSVVVACHAPSAARWFEVIVSPRRRLDRVVGATVMLARIAGPDEWSGSTSLGAG
jgi:hypothetical protein